MASERGLASTILPRRRGVPPEFIEQLKDMGLPISHVGITHTLGNIAAGSPQWLELVEMLHSLPPTNVEILLSLSGPDDVYEDPNSPDASYIGELVDHLPTLNPGCLRTTNQHVSGDARTIIEAVVRTLEDPPACCPAARCVPDWHYIASVKMEFSNLLLRVTVSRRSM